MRPFSVFLLLCCSIALLLFFAPPAAAQWSLVAEYSQVDGSPYMTGAKGELPDTLRFDWFLIPHESELSGSASWREEVTAADVGRTYEARLDGFDLP